MDFELIEFNGKKYPAHQAKGFASQWAFKFAEIYLPKVGLVYDIGFHQEEWKYPGAIGIDITKEDGFDAYNLPPMQADAIFSSHLLEHLPNYVSALDYWHSKLKSGGVLFMYLPNCEYQEYWRPTSNKKHLVFMTPEIIEHYFQDTKTTWANHIVTKGYDLNGSFYAVAQKQ